MAGELVLPPVKSGKETILAEQVARTPLMAAFQVGWTKFVLTSVHILYGEKTAEPVARVEEIEQVAKFLLEPEPRIPPKRSTTSSSSATSTSSRRATGR